MNEDFIKLLERLVDAGVEFVLVGGFAGVVHGCTYVTQDIDICCDFSQANLLALQKTLSDLKPVHRMTPGRLKLELTKKNCTDFKDLYLDTKIGQLDCLSVIDGVGDYTQVKKESRIIKIGKIKIHVLDIDALIKSKKTLNHPRDRQAIIQLEAIKKLKKGL
jgi:hypothetical protein